MQARTFWLSLVPWGEKWLTMFYLKSCSWFINDFFHHNIKIQLKLLKEDFISMTPQRPYTAHHTDNQIVFFIALNQVHWNPWKSKPNSHYLFFLNFTCIARKAQDISLVYIADISTFGIFYNEQWSKRYKG